MVWANLGRIVERPDPFRPSWRIRTPAGADLTIEFDSLRRLWRVSPGDYTRRRLPDALAQATSQQRDAEWITGIERELSAKLGQQASVRLPAPE